MKEIIAKYNLELKDLLILVEIVLIIIVLVLQISPINQKVEEKPEEVAIENVDDSEQEKIVENFYVDIKGEVKKPGVYQATDKMIVNDLIKLAGGLTKSATTADINLSKALTSEMVIVISNKKKSATTTNQVTETKSDNNASISNEQPKDNNKISINNATKDELMTLSGIGESKALNIINYRDTNGPFKTIEDILNVTGIGESVFAQIKENITL